MRFKNKTTIVTGAASGIGQATALRFANEGAKVFCVDVNDTGLKETLGKLQAINKDGAFAIHNCDVSDEQSVQSCIEACIKQFQSIDVLAHLAGILRYAHTVDMSFSDWRKIISVNLDGTFLICRGVLPHLEKTSGNIVNASSSSALMGLPYGAAYGASKGGVLSLTRAIAIEYINRGVRANCICPAGILTPMTKDIKIVEGADQKLFAGHESVGGKWGTPEEVAAVVAMLASADASHINGEEIRVDGGALS